MPRDNGSLVDFDELAAVLGAHEGPDHPQPAQRTSPSRRTNRFRWGIAAGVAALLVGSGLGFGLASSLTPSGDAAEAPEGLGFLPERGWHVLRSPFEASAEQPSFAVASNVPVTRLDVSMARNKDWSGYPHQAISDLGPRGIVMVASFALRGVHGPSDASFPRQSLPLRMRDAVSQPWPTFHAGPLSRYDLRAAVGRHNVIVHVYFGTAEPARGTIVAAQRQLDRLVVGSTRPAARVAERALPAQPSAGSSAATGPRIVDRTFACSPLAFGGMRDLDLDATPPRIDRGGRSFAAALEVRTGAGLNSTSLVLVRTRFQRLLPGWAVGRAVGGAAGVFSSTRLCAPSTASVPLSHDGLSGPPVGWHKELDCAVPGRVLVHVRAVLQKPTTWRRVDRAYEGASRPVVESKVAIRLAETGKPVAYMEHDAKGKTMLWYFSGCR